ncbi:hypothetical protein V499_08545 [Pseudogymnoascus sp. VKM F-103]|uniref:High-temperature-induced dauer-formation protein n=1 Tax=Pseudogymnoascus verrucosus TaxID=342668 RepID=A0A1B8GKY7_9PEZI|nr:uncharacterized protein VE01_05358 [Pseudogymnoascus verrucosus]KFY71253.1 hypothetical protein V499_08545 [Pseudogymnoascus sp. VKM F-103]OBT96503.1 hypothetical protein VE01_05358 [Pseudogymnoascus verrucosus]
MGASDSKLVFKKGIFKLSEERNIAADDPYWTSFWELPESAEDVFNLFSPADVRRTRDDAKENLETLMVVTVTQLSMLRNHPSFPDPEIAPEQDALNCVRVLTRILPYLYESDSLHEWEDRIFWGPRRKLTRKASISPDVLFDDTEASLPPNKALSEDEKYEDAKPLAEELIDTLIDLLFFGGFTIPATGKNKVSYAIWQSGVGCNTPVGTSKEFESNRCEILRLLLTLTSKSMYMSANMLPVVGIKAITYITTCPEKQVVLSVLCSLLNTTLKYNPASWTVPYNHMVFKDPKQILVTYAIQFLLVALVYPVPEAGPSNLQKNYYRHFLGRLHRPQDFQFMVDGMTRILNQPIVANTSYLPGSHASTKCAPEIIMLFWEITQCNKRFRSFIIDTDRSHDFVILLIFYIVQYKLDPAKQGVVKMCAFLLQTLSVEPNFGTSLNKKFLAQDTLPASIRIQSFNGSYSDFLIQSIFSIITTSQGKLSAVYPALLAVIANISGYLVNINAITSSKLQHLFASMSAPSFLLANESNHELLQSLLESMNAIIEHQYHKNANFIYTVIRNRKRFQALRSFTLESGQAEIERQNQRRKEANESGDTTNDSELPRFSMDSIQSPTTAQHRRPSQQNIPEEENTFAIGDDDDDDHETDDGHAMTPSYSTPTDQPSRASSITSDFEDAVPTQVRGMSEKARGKRPAGTPTFSRQNSTTSLGGPTQNTNGQFEPSAQWIESWLPILPLHTILNIIDQVTPLLPRTGSGTEGSTSILRIIQDSQPHGIDQTDIRVQSFEWSPLSLGWYESLLWSFVYVSEMQVSKGTVGVWNGTSIRLFRVQETAAAGPSLASPRGAVDAVGSNIVSRIGSMNLGRVGQLAVGGSTGNAQQAGNNRGTLQGGDGNGARAASPRSAVV